MAIPTLITELSTTAAANSPAGSDSPSTLDDIQRAHASFIAQLRDADALKLNASAVSAFGLTLIDDATAAAARATLEVTPANIGAAASGPLAGSGITGAAASGANTDITSITGNAATATKLSNDTGSAPSYSCRAWVNFNGTGTVAIRASGNVSSITDNGTGDYTVNFTTAMQDTGYSAACSGRRSASGIDGVVVSDGYTTGSFTCKTSNGAGALEDFLFVNVAIFR